MAVHKLSIARNTAADTFLSRLTVCSITFLSVDGQHPLQGSYGAAELERQSDRRRPTQGGGEHDDARLMAELVAESLNTDDDGDTTGRRGAGGRGTIRVYRLHNRCSKRFVRVAGKRVDAAAPLDDMYSK